MHEYHNVSDCKIKQNGMNCIKVHPKQREDFDLCSSEQSLIVFLVKPLDRLSQETINKNRKQ